MSSAGILTEEFAQAAANAGLRARRNALASGHPVVFVDDFGRYVEELPDGTKVEITLPADSCGSGDSFYEAAREYIGIFDGPADLSTHPRHLEDFGG